MLFTNEDEGTQSRVVALQSKPGWYAVTLRDLDSGEVLPIARHVDNLDQAIKLAKEWANIGPNPIIVEV
jgi:hypothetical protein